MLYVLTVLVVILQTVQSLRAGPISMNAIQSIKARQIYDSRGNPTVEVDMVVGGVLSRASVPSGASTGAYEAVELRDGGDRHMGKGVLTAVANVNNILAPKLIGMDCRDQTKLDMMMNEIDGTANKGKVGANAVLGISLAASKAGAAAKGVPLYRHFADLAGNTQLMMPVPCFNVINGGSHAGNKLPFQEYFVIPTGAETFKEGMLIGTEVYHNLAKILKKKFGGDATLIGDEGGFAPPCDSRSGIELVMEAIEKAGYLGSCKVGLDVAASEFKVKGSPNGKDAKYDLGMWDTAPQQISGSELMEFYGGLIRDFPIVTIEDGFDEDDWENWSEMVAKYGKDVQIVGDDLTVTNRRRSSVPWLTRRATRCCSRSTLNELGLGELCAVREFATDDQDRMRGCYNSHISVLAEAQARFADRPTSEPLNVLVLEDSLSVPTRIAQPTLGAA